MEKNFHSHYNMFIRQFTVCVPKWLQLLSSGQSNCSNKNSFLSGPPCIHGVNS